MCVKYILEMSIYSTITNKYEIVTSVELECLRINMIKNFDLIMHANLLKHFQVNRKIDMLDRWLSA